METKRATMKSPFSLKIDRIFLSERAYNHCKILLITLQDHYRTLGIHGN